MTYGRCDYEYFLREKIRECNLFWLLFLLMAPRLSFAQASELESLRATVKDMEQQMQKALERIDQLEKEKASDSARDRASGKIDPSGAKRAVGS